MNSFKKKEKKLKKKRDKKQKHKKEKRKRRSSSTSSSTSSTSVSSSSSSSSDKKHKRKKHKRDRKKTKELRSDRKGECSQPAPPPAIAPQKEEDFSIPINLMDNKHKAPETREEYEKRQSVIRRVVDPETGRTRLIKGDGEILEEIVSRDRHLEINRVATQTDGQVYQNKTIGWALHSDKK